MRGDLRVWRALERARRPAAGGGLAVANGYGISRRRVLGLLAAGAGAAALPDPGWARGRPRRVAIVGGGLAGLVALRRLRAAGVEAELYEARGAVGGRTRSVSGVFGPGQAFDEGGQLVNSDHGDVIALCRRLGLRLVDREAYGPSAEVQLARSGVLADEAALAEALRPLAARIAADSDRLDRGGAAVLAEIDALSVREYLDRTRLEPGDARDAVEAGIRTEYGSEPEDSTAVQLLFNLPTVNGRRLTRLPNSDERYVVDGGSERIAQGLHALLGRHVRLGRRLVRVAIEPEGVVLGFADGGEVRADRLIVALPASILREVEWAGPVPDPWRACMVEVGLGVHEKLVAGFTEAAWRPVIGFSGAIWAGNQGFAEAWDALSGAPQPGPGALAFLMSAGEVAAADGVATAVLGERFAAAARVAAPALGEPGALRRTAWSKDPLTKGSYVSFRPGQLTRFGGLLSVEGTRTAGFGPVTFAGEWVSDAWPGYMNGAAQTGRLAAKAVMAAAGPQRRLQEAAQASPAHLAWDTDV